MSIVTFARATRRATHVIITAYGESGCGKTYSLIKLGRGLVGPNGRLGMIDTETGRGLIYADVAGGYEYGELTPPFTPERYVEAIDAAEEAGFDALILDSGSHEWEGLGGILEIAEASNQRGLVKWAAPKSRHKRYVHRLLQSRMHLLISLRAKEKMVQLSQPPFPPGMKSGDIISSGYAPIQDKRFVFETTVQIFLPTVGRRGVPAVEKCPEDLLGAFPDGVQISEETGRKIAEWLNGGIPIDQNHERLKRQAAEVAALGLDAYGEFWGKLDRGGRAQLLAEHDNLKSIAKTADDDRTRTDREEQAERERTSPDLDAPFGGRAPAPVSEHVGDPEGHREGNDATTAETSPAAPEDQEDAFGVKPLPAEDRYEARQIERHKGLPLLGNREPDNLTVPLPVRPTVDHMEHFARQMLHMIGEAPPTAHRLALIRMQNERGLATLKAVAVERYDEVQAALARRPA